MPTFATGGGIVTAPHRDRKNRGAATRARCYSSPVSVFQENRGRIAAQYPTLHGSRIRLAVAGASCLVALAVSAVGGRVLPGEQASSSQSAQIQRFVSVLEDDRPVLGLTVEDFVVEEDGQRREVLRVEPAAVPLEVAVLVDDGMVASSNLGHVREALTNFVQALVGHDVALYSFGNQRRTVVPFTKNTALLTEATTQFAGFSESSAYLIDAIQQTALDLARRGAQRPALVLLTGEERGTGDTAIRGSSHRGSRLTPDAARDRDAEAVIAGLVGLGVVVNAVVTRSLTAFAGFTDDRSSRLSTVTSGAGAFRWMQENRERERLIDQAPSRSGGRLYNVSSTSGIDERLVRIADELLNQYLVTYSRPPRSDVPKDIVVDAVDRDLTVRSAPSLEFIPYVSETVYVLDGTIVEPDMVFHHAPDCPGLGGLGGQNAVPVSLDALGDLGTHCPYCPNRSRR